MKTYNGMTRSQLISFCASARAAKCKAENAKKYGDGYIRKNENEDGWKKLYRSYPITSKTAPTFSLSAEYEMLCKM